MGGFALSTSTSIANDLTRSSIFPTPISIAPSPCFFPHHLPSFHGVFASTKQKKRRSSGSSPSRSWSYEHLMVVWDEVFERCCSDPARASLVRNLSHNGLALHGRGCVLVYESVQTKPRGKGTGFTSKPSKSSLDLPFFETVEWRASYVPREFLIDPSKAAVEALNAPNGGAVIDAAPASKNSETHIDNDAASKEDDNASEEKAAPDQCRQAEAIDACNHNTDDFVQLVSQEMLLSTRRGLDVTRLLSLTANFDPEVDNSRDAYKGTMVDMKTMDAGGEDPYNPRKEELVLLLHLVVDGRPALGADILVAYQEETDIEEERIWLLKLKYEM